MEKILFLAHTESDGNLPKAALEVLSAATDLVKQWSEADLTLGLIGGTVDPAVRVIGGCGAVKILAVSGPDFGDSRYATDAAAAEALIKKSQATLVLAPATSRFSRAIPGAAFRVKGRVDTRVSGYKLEGATVQIERWYYRQRMAAHQTRTERPWIWLMDSGVYAPWSGSPGSLTAEMIPVSLPDGSKRTTVKGVEAPSSDAQTIRPGAEMLFVAGAGWTKKQSDGIIHAKDAEGLILGFLNQAKASLGSSKSLVDQSTEGEAVLPFMSHLNQIGQTGSTPRHLKGLATCCHGEEPHVVGWRFISERRAVNLDPNCGWAQGKADVLYVADAFQVIAKVNELLAAKAGV